MPAYGEVAEGGLEYPWLLEEADENCRCRFHCYPQITAKLQVRVMQKEKPGFDEFVDPSTPPRFYLRYRIDTRTFTLGDPPEYGQFWEEYNIDPDTGIGDGGTISDPPFLGHAALAATPTVLVDQPTIRVTEWVIYSGDVVQYRVVQVETLEDEYITDWLKDDVFATLPEWPEFGASEENYDLVDEELPNRDAWNVRFVFDGCYSGGVVTTPQSSGTLSAPSVWRLSEDETTFLVQNVRYKIVAPHLNGPCTFRIGWSEQFTPDGGDPDAPDNAQFFNGSEALLESDVLELTLIEENGENYLCCAQLEPE